MADTSVSQSTGSSTGESTGTSTSLPVVTQTPQSEWGLQLSQLLGALTTNQYNWAIDQYNNGQGITDQNINQYMKLAGYGAGLAQNLLGRYENVFEPLMNQYIQQAGTYNSEARQRFNMGAAESTAAQADQAAQNEAERQLQSYGANPNSGRYQDRLLTSRMQDAAARAGAGTQASVNTAATGRQMLQQAAQMGQNIPGMTVNALQSAMTGVTGAENAILGQQNTGANLMNTVPNFGNAAANAIKLPPVGQQSTSAQQSQNKSAQQSTSQGAGGGQKDQQKKPQPTGPQDKPAPINDKGTGPPYFTPASALPIKNTSGTEDTQDNPALLPQWLPAAQSTPFVDPSAPVNWPDATNTPVIPQGTFNRPNQGSGPSFGPDMQGLPQPGQTPQDQFPPTQFPQQQNDPYGGQNFNPDVTGTPQYNQSNDPAQFYNGPPQDTSNQNSGGYFPDQGTTFIDNTGASGLNDNMFPQYDPTGGNQSPGGDQGGWGSDQNIGGVPDTQMGGYNQQGSDPTGGNQSSGGYQGGWGADPSLSPDPSQMGGGYDPTGGDQNPGGYGYAAGGRVRPRGMIPTSGGAVPRSASPSQGRRTDDIPARLNAGEFVIPRDVTQHFGTKHFQDLIAKSRKLRTGMAGPPARPKMKPAMRMRPTFSSHPMMGQ